MTPLSNPYGLFSEADVQGRVVDLAARMGIQLMRNNSGVGVNPNGQPVRFGLGNISKKFNEVFKTPDLVGLDPHGFFIGVECKEPDWRYTGTKREIAQLNALNKFNEKGGLGLFIRCPYVFAHTYSLFITGRFHDFKFRYPQYEHRGRR